MIKLAIFFLLIALIIGIFTLFVTSGKKTVYQPADVGSTSKTFTVEE